MKLKSFFICILVATPQVFAETKSIQKLKDPDPIYVLERCAANSISLLRLLESMKNKKKEEMDFQEVMTKRFGFFLQTLINYHQDQNKNLSKDEIKEITFSRIFNLEKIVSKDIKKPYFDEDMAYCKSKEVKLTNKHIQKKNILSNSSDKTKSQNQCQGKDSKKWHNCFGTMNLKHGAKHTGYFMNGKPEGQGTFKAPNGHQYVGNYKNGAFHGKGTMNYPNGAKYIGMWKEGKHHGKGSLTYYADGKYVGKFIGEFRNGKSHQGKIITPDGREIILDAEKLNQYKKEVQQ